MDFSEININNPLRNALDDLGITKATPIQAEAFPILMSGADLVAVAQTGTGKTFAYLLPILRHLKYSDQKHPRVLILVPTRELAVQVQTEILKLSRYMSLRVVAVFGGVNINTQKKDVASGMDIIVATPGRLIDLSMSRAIKLKKIKQLVIDEVDEMLNMGFRKQLQDVFMMLPERRQNMLFSATMTKEIEMLVDEVFFQPQKIMIAASGTSADGIEQFVYRVPNYYTKINLLNSLLIQNTDWTKVLIFAATKKMADEVFEKLQVHFPNEIGIIHSNKSQNYRLRSVQNFDTGVFRLLIATDLIARGLDFKSVSHVINIDTPEDAENYIHRVGRTARAQEEGVAITMVNTIECTKESLYLEEIEKLMHRSIQELALPSDLSIETDLTEREQVQYQQKNASKDIDHLKESKGAFHEKKEKNTKVNRAQEKRLARKAEKFKAKRRKKN